MFRPGPGKILFVSILENKKVQALAKKIIILEKYCVTPGLGRPHDSQFLKSWKFFQISRAWRLIHALSTLHLSVLANNHKVAEFNIETRGKSGKSSRGVSKYDRRHSSEHKVQPNGHLAPQLGQATPDLSLSSSG